MLGITRTRTVIEIMYSLLKLSNLGISSLTYKSCRSTRASTSGFFLCIRFRRVANDHLENSNGCEEKLAQAVK